MNEMEKLLFDALCLAIEEIRSPSETPRQEVLDILLGVKEGCEP